MIRDGDDKIAVSLAAAPMWQQWLQLGQQSGPHWMNLAHFFFSRYVLMSIDINICSGCWSVLGVDSVDLVVLVARVCVSSAAIVIVAL